MIVYVIIHWYVDSEGFPDGDQYVEGTYASEQRAREVMFEKTGKQTALTRGYVEQGDERWRIQMEKVQD